MENREDLVFVGGEDDCIDFLEESYDRTRDQRIREVRERLLSAKRQMNRRNSGIKIGPRKGLERCKVCRDEKVSGIHYGAVTCFACKDFFYRKIKSQTEYRCNFNGVCTIDKFNRSRCRYCRFQKCLAVGMSPDSVKSSGDRCNSASKIDSLKRLIHCQVCGDKASGRNYGVVTCHSCKNFYQRHTKNQMKHRCVSNGDCTIDKSNRNSCQCCRFKKCLAVGMSRNKVESSVALAMQNESSEIVKNDVEILTESESDSQESGDISCLVCQKSFSSISDVVKHELKHKMLRYYCPVRAYGQCSTIRRRYHSIQHLDAHCRSKHSDKQPREFKWKCINCDALDSDYNEYRIHVWNEFNENRYNVYDDIFGLDE